MKLFISEAGSKKMIQLYDALGSRPRFLSAVARVESASAVYRLRKAGALSVAEASTVVRAALSEADRLDEVSVTHELLKAAIRMSEKHALRALDAIQLASALEAAKRAGDPPHFVSADEVLLRSASAEGFPILNPCD